MALQPTTPGRLGEAPPPPSGDGSVGGLRVHEWGAMGVPVAAVSVLGGEDAAVMAVRFFWGFS